MKPRDRMVLTAILVIAVLGVAWVALVSPERKKSGELAAQVSAAKSALQSAENLLAGARQAQAAYGKTYAAIVRLGKAVPPTEEVPSLIYQLAQASQQKDVQFAAITSGASATTGSGSSPAGAATGATFSQMPFTFIFNGSFVGLESMLRQLAAVVTRTPAGGLRVSGRLLTIQGVRLGASSIRSNELSASVTASAYVLPAESLTSALTSSSTGAPSSAGAAASSSPAPAAVVKVTP